MMVIVFIDMLLMIFEAISLLLEPLPVVHK